MEEIIFRWAPGETEIVVGHKKMAQFEYVGSELESHVDRFPTG